jgi:signal transduction protein with GAF and PtsI domain
MTTQRDSQRTLDIAETALILVGVLGTAALAAVPRAPLTGVILGGGVGVAAIGGIATHMLVRRPDDDPQRSLDIAETALILVGVLGTAVIAAVPRAPLTGVILGGIVGIAVVGGMAMHMLERRGYVRARARLFFLFLWPLLWVVALMFIGRFTTWP